MSNSKAPDKMQENVAIILFSVAMTSLAAFAIFVPLVIIPSIRGMAVTHDFDPTPVRCVTVDVVFQQDSEECEGWSLCKQGCENPPTICHQVLVNYRKHNSTYPVSSIITEQEYQNATLWDEYYTKLSVNAKGCGEAPSVLCNELGDDVGEPGRTYDCYYSRRNPRLVVIYKNWDIPASSLVVTLGLPATLLTTSLTIFCLLAAEYLPCVPQPERLIKSEAGGIGQQGHYRSIQEVNSRA